MKALKIVSMSLACILIGLSGGFFLARKAADRGAPAPHAAAPAKKEKKILFYRNPMNPSITSPVPAKDEMGMDYVPVYEGEESSGGPAGTVKIDPVVEQNIGVRTSMARVMKLGRVIHAYGRIAYDEEALYSVYPRFKGWIDKVYVSRTGDVIKKGDLLASIYSPELVSTEKEYLLAIESRKGLEKAAIDIIRQDADALIVSARKRLELFGISEEEISRLEKTGRVMTNLAIRSEVSGTVVKVNARKGQAVSTTTRLYSIADLSTVWVLADVFESDLPWIKAGDEATVSFPAGAGKAIKGRIEFIYPFVDPRTRTVKVRMACKNPGGTLRPEMFVNVSITAGPRKALAVPSEAIIRSGEREIVFIRTAPGRYEPREVTTGVEARGMVEILQGLDPMEEVVTSAQFLIDSESKLREATLKMMAPKGKKSMDMEMDMKPSGKEGANTSMGAGGTR